MAAVVVQFTTMLFNVTTNLPLVPGTVVTVTNMDNSSPVTTSSMYTDITGTAVAGANTVTVDSNSNITVYLTSPGSDATGRYKFTPAGLGTQILTVVSYPTVAAVLNEVYWFSAATGVTATDKANVSAGVTAVTNTTGLGGKGQLGPGQYNVGDLAILLPENTATNKAITIQGAGMASTQLYFSTDRGTGTQAIAGNGSALTGLFPNTITDLTIYGPGNVNAALGVAPAFMDGVRFDSRIKMERVRVQAFRCGLVVTGNHSIARDCETPNNFYGVYFNSGTNGGDIIFDNCNLGGIKMASVGIATNCNCTLSMYKGHVGFGPYAFYFESPSTGLNLGGCSFYGTSFEAIGNSYFYSPDQSARMEGVGFYDVGNWSRIFSTYGIAGTTLNPGFRLSTLTECTFYNSMPNGITDGPLFDINSYFRMTSNQFWTSLSTQGGSYPWMQGGTVNYPVVRLTDTINDNAAFVSTAAGAVAVGQLLQYQLPTVAYFQVQPWGTGGNRGRYAGVALTASAGFADKKLIVVATRSNGVNVQVDSAAASSYVLVASTATIGKATGIVYDGTTTSTNGRPIIGESQLSAIPTGGGTVTAHLVDGP